MASLAQAVPAEVVAVLEERGTYRRIWEIAWPVSVSTSTLTLLTLANLFWIGHLGTAAVAAVSLAGNILFIVFGISDIVYTGAVAIIARRVGEKNSHAAMAGAVHALCLAALLGVSIGIVGYLIVPAIVGFFDAAAEVSDTAIVYLRIMFACQFFLYVGTALRAAYQSVGNTRTPMFVNLVVVLLNAVIDPYFIFPAGHVAFGTFPLGWLGWGVAGGAVAACVSSAAGMILMLAVSAATRQPFDWKAARRIRLAPREFLRMLRVGTPASLTLIARPLSTFLLLKVIASFGTAAIAAFGIALRSFSFNWIFYSGINAAVATLVGQNLGARNLRQAENVVRRGFLMTSVLGTVFCFVYFLWSQQLILLFDSEPAVVAAGEPFVKLMALGFLFNAPMLPLVSAMNGAGETRVPMIAAFLANWPLKLPLAYALALPLGYGINGVWTGMLVSIVIESLMVFAWYRRGTWKLKQV
ncbi:MAG: MATE family efflux transporter [Deltaproteobacteria bacterium]|nr:MATE family efflux transporter [Deltaproteobacteria bacterium]